MYVIENVMDRQTLDLGFILRQFKKYKFSMDTLNDRLRLQKFIYLLQAHDIYLGYDYSWYLRGPYCTTLAKRGFVLESLYNDIPRNAKAEFADPVIQDRFMKFKRFIKGHETDTDYLEMLASLHILKIEGVGKKEAIEIVHAKKPNEFGRQRCSEIWDNDMPKLSREVGMSNPPGSISEAAYPFGNEMSSSSRYMELEGMDETKDMIDKPADRSIYYMLRDAVTDKHFHLVGRNMFRASERRPAIDTLLIDNDITTKLVITGKL